jgi:hypothetical protein
MNAAYETAVFTELHRLGADENYLRQSDVGTAIAEGHAKGNAPKDVARAIWGSIEDQRNPLPDL